MLKIKVPMAFLGTQGFSAHREGRYTWFCHSLSSRLKCRAFPRYPISRPWTTLLFAMHAGLPTYVLIRKGFLLRIAISMCYGRGIEGVSGRWYSSDLRGGPGQQNPDQKTRRCWTYRFCFAASLLAMSSPRWTGRWLWLAHRQFRTILRALYLSTLGLNVNTRLHLWCRGIVPDQRQ